MVKTEPLDEYETEEYQRALRLYTKRVEWIPEEDPISTDSGCHPSPSESPSMKSSTPEYEPLFCCAVSMDQIWRTYEDTVAAINVLYPHNDCSRKLLDSFQGPPAPNYPPPMYPQEVVIPSSIPSPPASPSPPSSPAPPSSPPPPVAHPVRQALVPHLHHHHPYFPNHRNPAPNLLPLPPFTSVQLGLLMELLAKINGNAGALARTIGPSEELDGTIGLPASPQNTDESPEVPRIARKGGPLSKYQLDILWNRFEESHYIEDRHERDRLARVVGMTGKRINAWFRNRRRQLREGRDPRILMRFGPMYNLLQHPRFKKQAATKQMSIYDDYTEEKENSVVHIESKLPKTIVYFTDEQKCAMRKVMNTTVKISSQQYEILGKETGLTKQQMIGWIGKQRRASKRLASALEVLEECFQKNHQLDPPTLRYLMDTVKLTYTQVQQWFEERNEIFNEHQRRQKSLNDSQKSSVVISPKIDSSGFDTCDAELLQKAKDEDFYGMYELEGSPFYKPEIFWNHYHP